MELYIFGRFHAGSGYEAAVAEAINNILGPTRDEPGCLDIHAFRSTRDARLFFIHSRWVSQEAFELHATLVHTVRFIERVERLIDHPLDVARTELLG